MRGVWIWAWLGLLSGCGSSADDPDDPDDPELIMPGGAWLPNGVDTSQASATVEKAARFEGCASARPLSGDARQLHVSPHGDDAREGATLVDALATLQGAQAKLLSPLDSDVEIIVHDGSGQPELGGRTEYRYQETTWRAHSRDFRVVIRAAAGQAPVFDGRPEAEPDRAPRSFGLWLQGVDEPSNVTVQGLTFRSYTQVGIWAESSCNRLLDNKIYDVGDARVRCVWRDDPPSGAPLEVFDRPDCVEDWSRGSVPPGCVCEGYAGILLMHGHHNLVRHNDVIDTLNRQAKAVHAHAIYLSDGAGDSVVEDNYVRNVSGSPIKFSSGGNNELVLGNVAWRNYLDRAGNGIFFHDDPQGGGPLSPGNQLGENVATFPSFRQVSVLAEPRTSFEYFDAQDSGSYFQGARLDGTEEVVAASVVARLGAEQDSSDSSRAQVFVALNYPELGFTKVACKDAGAANNELRSVAFSSDAWQVKALAAGTFAGSVPSVIMAVECVPGKAGCTEGRLRTAIVAGRVDRGAYRFDGGTVLYDELGASPWRVVAMTAGKFGDDARDTLLVAAKVGEAQRVFRGDGATSQAADSRLGVDDGDPLYSSRNWSITAMTSGLRSDGTSSLFTAFESRGARRTTRIYWGDGISSAVATRVFESDVHRVTGLAFGRFGSGTPRLATALDDGGLRSVFVSDEGVADPLARQLYESASWTISSLAAGDVDDDDSDDELVCSFDLEKPGAPGLTRVVWGDGISDASAGGDSSGLSNGGAYYRSALEYP